MILFFGQKKPLTKKELLLRRMRRIQLIQQAINLHKENAEKTQKSTGGAARPDDEGLQGGVEDSWRGKVSQMRQGVQSHRAKAKARGKQFFRGR